MQTSHDNLSYSAFFHIEYMYLTLYNIIIKQLPKKKHNLLALLFGVVTTVYLVKKFWCNKGIELRSRPFMRGNGRLRYAGEVVCLS